MTSISNYESVELPNEPVKEKRNIFDYFKNIKGKKLGFSVKKKHIALASMVLMLSGAVYVNYLYAAGNMEDFLETGKNYGDSILVEGTASEEITNSAAYFSQARVSRQKSRDEAVATIENLYGVAMDDSEEISVLAEGKSFFFSVAGQIFYARAVFIDVQNYLIKRIKAQVEYRTEKLARSATCGFKIYLIIAHAVNGNIASLRKHRNKLCFSRLVKHRKGCAKSPNSVGRTAENDACATKRIFVHGASGKELFGGFSFKSIADVGYGTNFFVVYNKFF